MTGQSWACAMLFSQLQEDKALNDRFIREMKLMVMMVIL